MSVVQVVKDYVMKMITESEPGYKIMLMDKETVSEPLIVFLQTVLLHNAFMFSSYC